MSMLFDALVGHYKAKKSEAMVNLSVYINNPVGVGEHPDVFNEARKLLEQAEHAESCLCLLEDEKEFFGVKKKK